MKDQYIAPRFYVWNEFADKWVLVHVQQLEAGDRVKMYHDGQVQIFTLTQEPDIRLSVVYEEPTVKETP
jgi:hypothetical protein